MTPGVPAARARLNEAAGLRAAGLDEAGRLLACGRAADALPLVERALAERPGAADVHHLLGLCRQGVGDVAGAEAAFRAARTRDPGHDGAAVALAELLGATARSGEGLSVLRRALAANRRSVALSVRLAGWLTEEGKAAEALAVLGKPAAGAAPDHAVLAAQAQAYRALGQVDKARAAQLRATALYPDSAVAHHNLAALDGDLGRFEAAAQGAARALAKGSAAQTWLVYARALLGLGRLDEAERAFREAVARQPTYLDAHRELAQLIWMRSEDRHAATAVLDGCIAGHPHVPELAGLRATILDHAGDAAGAYDALVQAIGRHPGQAGLHLAASQLATRLPGGAGRGVRHAEQALALLPGSDEAQTALLAACLGAGEAERAAAIASALVARRPFDQRALAYQATAWRLLGDARYAGMYDYAAFVRAWEMDVPEGWASLDSYLAELAGVLGELHAFRTHPFDQSLRHGSQASNLLASEHTVIRAFFQAVDGPIRRHLAWLGRGAGPVRSRNVGGFRFQGAWSVRLRAGGFHTDHVHPEGWLSSACYIALPSSGAEERERGAWIKFGEPGLPTAPPLGAEHFVEPRPGMLVLFPSYMWHGTVPFESEGRRLSVAFDLLPGA